MLLLAGPIYAQRLTGLVMGELTRMPLGHATVSSGGSFTQTNAYGLFTLNGIKAGDSVRINCAGYAYYAFKPAAINRKDTMVIYLQPISYVLKEVTIRSNRNAKADSARMRKEFASVFAYKPMKVTDVFTTINPSAYVPYNYIDVPNNTTNIVGFDVLRLVSFLSKKKDKKSKLQQMLLKDEANNFVGHAFSQEKVMSLTTLKGDSLLTFMDRYQPSPAQAKKMTAYEMVRYIRKCYAEFVAKPKS